MIIEKVRKQIKENKLIEEKDTIIAGLSGGADSVCLLLVLNELRKEFNFSLEAIHVEHGIRGEESRQDALFSEMLCKQLNIIYHMQEADVPKFAKEKGIGLEEAARCLRYEIFQQTARRREGKIALAHHMDDNAETILFQMLRGSSLTGLCGIRPIRKDESGIIYIRPLLMVYRKEIESYLKERKQSFCIDSTNTELDYSRNYLRNKIIPELTQVNVQAVKHINETAGTLRELRDFLDEQTQVYWEQTVAAGEETILDLPKLRQLHMVLQKEIIYKAIVHMAGGRKDISSIHVEQVRKLIQSQSGKKCTLLGGITAIKENETIRLIISDKNVDIIKKSSEIKISEKQLSDLLENGGSISIRLQEDGKEMQIQAFKDGISQEKIPRKTYTKWMDYDKISKGFCIRTRQSGDYLICDDKGHRKKLKQYFVDEKIPVTKRDEILIFTQENRVLWVAGGRMSEHVKVSEQTKAVIEITIKEET